MKNIQRRNIHDRTRVHRSRSSFDNKPSKLIPTLIVFIGVLILSAVTAGVWQILDKTPYVEQSAPIIPTLPVENVSNKENTELQKPNKTESDNKEENKEDVKESEPQGFGLVHETERQRNKYFEDAVFVGDSITEGIKIYDIMSNATVLSHTGINLNNIMNKPVIPNGDSKITIPDKLATLSPKKVYILMGANSMGLEKSAFIDAYKILVNKVRELQPDAIIYVQSILPVTKKYEDNRPMFSNAKIDDYNKAVESMCEELNVYYLNVAEVFKDENGRLPDKASPYDGMHFGTDWYLNWFEYLRNHAIPV